MESKQSAARAALRCPPWLIASFAIAYAASVQLGLTFAYSAERVATFWPASGLLFAFLLLSPYRRWAWLLAAAFAGQVAVDPLRSVVIGDGSRGSFVWFVIAPLANCAEASAGAMLVRWLLRGETELVRFRNVSVFVLVAALGCPAAAALLGATCGTEPASYWSRWQTWWFADVLGVLVVAPFVLSLVAALGPRREGRRDRRVFEGLVVISVLLIVTQLVFGADPAPARWVGNLPYVVFPFLLWAALRLRTHFVTAALLAVGMLLVFHGDGGRGPFVYEGIGVHELVLSIQVFLAATSASTLLVAAITAERRRAEHSLESARLDLEERVHERTIELETSRRELELAHGDLEQRVKERTGELLELNRALEEEMAQRNQLDEEHSQLQADLRQAHKMEAVGQLAGGVAHDFNNALTVIQGYGELALSETDRDGVEHEALTRILDAAGRAGELTKQLLAFSRRRVLQHRAVDVNELIRETEQLLERVIDADIALRVETDPSAGAVWTDPTQLEHALLNLAVNARDAMPSGGELSISVRPFACDELPPDIAARLAPAEYVCIRVSDTGHGIADDVREHVFEPFFTTKGPGRGTGLGLSTVYGIVHQCGGTVGLESAVDEGTTFDLYLPVLEREIELKPAPPRERTTGAAGGETILLVEDEEVLRGLIESALRGAGYRVLEASDGVEALEVAERADGQGKRIDLLISDVIMPRMSGPELSRRLRELHPALRTILTSGHPELPGSPGSPWSLEPGTTFLEKPFGMGDLRKRIRGVLAGFEGSRELRSPR